MGERRRRLRMRWLLSLAVCCALAAPYRRDAAGSARRSPPPGSQPLDGFLTRARSYYGQGEVAQAIAVLQHALQVDNRYVPAHHLLGSIYLSRREYGRAL